MSIVNSIYPSILAADLGYIAETVQELNNYDFKGIHVDVMDGHFVPEISFGVDMVRVVHRYSRHPISVHLMVERPMSKVASYIEAGASEVIVHREVLTSPDHHAETLNNMPARIGLSLKPGGWFELIDPYLEYFQTFLAMTVAPGSCGQKFMPSVCPFISRLRDHLDKNHIGMEIMVDGGITPETLKIAKAAGANSYVAGSSLLGAGLLGISDAVRRFNLSI